MFKYTLFAIVATLINIGTQYIFLLVYDKIYSLYIAMFFGTITGLVVKYILDKKYIFYFKVKNKKEDIFKFVLYSLMGFFTTLIFWIFELLFNALFPFNEAKYIGAVIGLTIGYITKYHIDKKFTFNLRKYIWVER